jgi:hypothetical protein
MDATTSAYAGGLSGAAQVLAEQPFDTIKVGLFVVIICR